MARVGSWVRTMRDVLRDVAHGKTYAYLDSRVIDVSVRSVSFDGLYAWHDEPVMPQVRSVRAGLGLDCVLARREYWDERVLV
jgi:hypothetical protein